MISEGEDTRRLKRGQRPPFGELLEDVDAVLVYSHMNPDPDTVGSALGLRFLLRERYGKKVGLCYRGIVGRAENRVMLRLLARDMLPARDIDRSDYDAAILVDAQPGYGFDGVEEGLRLLGVVDHHPPAVAAGAVPFMDIRPDYGSTSTIITEYLQAEELDPPAKIATALFYGLKTDTMDLCRRASPADMEAYEWLFPRVDRKLLSQIENPSLSRDYFDTFAAAVTRAVTYRRTVITEVGRVAYPDMVAEIADRMIKLEGTQWSICFGLHDQRIYFSVRTNHPTRDAGEVVKKVLREEGVGGGHDTMAAGRVQLLEESEETYQRVVRTLWERFLEVLGEDSSEGRRLVRTVTAEHSAEPPAS